MLSRQQYEQYLEQWIAAYCGKLSKRGRLIAAAKMAALEEAATAYVMRLKREEGGQ